MSKRTLSDRECLKFLVVLLVERRSKLRRSIKEPGDAEIYESELERSQEVIGYLHDKINELNYNNVDSL